MKHLYLSIIVVCLLCSCAQHNRAVNESNSDTIKRYFQYRHPLSSTIGLQVAATNENGCKSLLANMKEHDKPHSYCTANSASELLPYRMTVRNKPYNFILDLETRTMSDCSVLSKEMLESEAGKENLELVSPCAKKK